MPDEARPYFERRLPVALILGSFFVVFVPLLALELRPNFFELAPHLLLTYAVGLGVTHFAITLSLYLQSQNLAHFTESRRNRLIYFGAPAAIFLVFALLAAADVRGRFPTFSLYFFLSLRLFDFFHVGRQSFGMLQIFKRPASAELPSWSRRGENAFFVGMALLQWQTALLGGRFAGDQLYATLPALGLGLLFFMLCWNHLFFSTEGARGRWIPLTYFAMQAVAAAAAAYRTHLYLVALTLHYVEYHVIMAPRCFNGPLDPASAVDRISAFFRAHKVAFYASLLLLVMLFELRSHAPRDWPAPAQFFVHLFDGLFFVHYFVEAFLWRFSVPFYRHTLAPLYFQPADAVPAPPASRPTTPLGHRAVATALTLTAALAAAWVLMAEPSERRLLGPLKAKAHLRWGVELAQDGELHKAREHLSEASQRDPGNAQARSFLKQLDQHVQQQRSP